MKQEIFWIWLAGFIDGDGCIYISKSKHKETLSGFQYCLCLEIAQSDKSILDEIKNKIGFGSNVWNKARDKYYVGINGNKHHSNRSFALKFSSNQALFVLEKVFPYLRIKKSQAKFGIDFQKIAKKKCFENNNKDRLAIKKEYWELQENYLQKIKELKIIAP